MRLPELMSALHSIGLRFNGLFMLLLSSDIAICLAVEPVDMRKAIDGLSVIVHEQLSLNSLSRHLFGFRNNERDKTKLLYWDKNCFQTLGENPF